MKYLKPDSELGYIEDYAEIESEKIENVRSSITCFTFGDYDENGEYIIEDDVVDDLISMEKFVVESDGNVEFCKSALKLDKQINFAISFEDSKISLLLIEKLKDQTNPQIEEMNEYVLDEYLAQGLVDRSIVYARWNVKPMGGYVLDIFSCEDEVLEKYFGVVNRFKYLLDSNKTLIEDEENIEDAEAEYFNDMMEVVKKYPNLYEEVIEQMQAFMEGKEDLFDDTKPWFLSHVNQLLNYCIKSNMSVLSALEKVQFEIEQHQLIVNRNLKKETLIPTDKSPRGTIFLKLSKKDENKINENESGVSKAVAALSSKYVNAVKKIAKILNPQQEAQEGKTTFTNKEMAILKLGKSGIKSAKGPMKGKNTILGGAVVGAVKAGAKPATKQGVKPAVKAIGKLVAKTSAKPGVKGATKPAGKGAAKVVGKPILKAKAKPGVSKLAKGVAKVAGKLVAKSGTKPSVKAGAKPVVKAGAKPSVAKPAAKLKPILKNGAKAGVSKPAGKGVAKVANKIGKKFEVKDDKVKKSNNAPTAKSDKKAGETKPKIKKKKEDKSKVDNEAAAKEEEKRMLLMYHAAANSYAYYHYSNPQVHYQPVVQRPVVQPKVTPTPTKSEPSPFDTWGKINKTTETREFTYQGGRNFDNNKGEYRTF